MAKSYFGPGSSGAVTPVAAAGWTGGYGGPQAPGAAGGMGWSVAPALGGMGYDPATNRQTNRAMDPNAGGMFAQAQGGAAGGDALEAARQRAFGSLGQGSSIFRGGLGQGVQQNLMDRVSGQQQPYDQATQDRMFAAAADQSNAAAAAQEQRARDFFANSGTAGSGAQLGGLLDVATTHDQNMQAARSDISNRAQLENFAARERAANDATGFMGSQSAGEAPYRLKEADLLSQYESTSQGADPQIAALMRLLSGGQQSPRAADGGFRMGETGANKRVSQSSTRRTSRQPSDPPTLYGDDIPNLQRPVASPASGSAPANRFTPDMLRAPAGQAFGGYNSTGSFTGAPNQFQGAQVGIPASGGVQASGAISLAGGGQRSKVYEPYLQSPWEPSAPPRPQFSGAPGYGDLASILFPRPLQSLGQNPLTEKPSIGGVDPESMTPDDYAALSRILFGR